MGKSEHRATTLDDDPPDLGTPYWREQFAKAKVRLDRPNAAVIKVSSTVRMDPDMVERLGADGQG